MAEEEFSEHTRLLQLEAAALKDVEQYGSCALTDKARVQKLSLTIQDKLSQIRAVTRDLELLVEELDSDEERQQAATLLAQHKVEYQRIQEAFKAAALAQRTAALRSAAEERRELLAGGDAAVRQRKLQTEADAVAVAEDVTGGLRRTRQVLAEELEHTSATLAAMEASHSSLAKTRDEYGSQHRHLKRSRGLLGTLNWQTKSETYMLWMGLSLFVLVCAYVFQKRAGHFIPDSLKPAALLHATGLTSGGSRPLPVPGTRARPPPGNPRHSPAARVPPEPAPEPVHVQADPEPSAYWEPEVPEPHLPPVPSPAPDPQPAATAAVEDPPYQPYQPYQPLEHEDEMVPSVYAPAAAEAEDQAEQPLSEPEQLEQQQQGQEQAEQPESGRPARDVEMEPASGPQHGQRHEQRDEAPLPGAQAGAPANAEQVDAAAGTEQPAEAVAAAGEQPLQGRPAPTQPQQLAEAPEQATAAHEAALLQEEAPSGATPQVQAEVALHQQQPEVGVGTVEVEVQQTGQAGEQAEATAPAGSESGGPAHDEL